MKSFCKYFFVPFLTLIPAISFASDDTYESLTAKIINDIIKDGVVPLLIALGVLYFLWGGLLFIQSAGDTKARDEGKKRMVVGLIGLAVMVSVWGLVKIVSGSFGVTDMSIPQF